MSRTKQPPSRIDQIGSLLDEGCAPDEIAVLLGIEEREVRRIAQLLDERGPADPAPDVDVQAVTEQVEDLPDVPALYADDVRPLLGDDGPALARQALVTIADHVDHLDDVQALAGMLGLGPALDDWTPRAPVEASEPVENQDTPEASTVQVAAEAIARGDFIVCMTRCYACQFGECQDPPAWHTWAEKDDIEHAAATGQPDPSKSRCACSCAVVEAADAHEMPRDVTPAADTVRDGVQRAREPVVLVYTPDDVDETSGMVCACGHLRSEHRSDGCVHGLDRATANAGCPCPLNQDGDVGPLAPAPEHVHDVGPAWDEDGTPYALCATCGHRWDRQPCEVCGLNVTGLVIARTGRARHPHHPKD